MKFNVCVKNIKNIQSNDWIFKIYIYVNFDILKLCYLKKKRKKKAHFGVFKEKSLNILFLVITVKL